jgi:hypothetical protein
VIEPTGLSREATHSYHDIGERLGVQSLKKCVDAVQAYFETKNKVWVTGDLDALRKVGQVRTDAEWWKHIVRGIQAKERDMKHRHSKVLRSHAHIFIRELEEHEDQSTHATVEERVTWVYRDGLEYGVESRVIQHRQRWAKRGTQWSLQKAWESDEKSAADTSIVQGTPTVITRPMPDGTRETTYKNCTAYDRVRALRYAELWWNGANPSFPNLADDCTNFISQCLWAGQMPIRGGSTRASGWWYQFGTKDPSENWSYSWTTSQALYLYLLHKVNASQVKNARDLRIGDLVFYDWGGNGRYHHTSIVTDFDQQGDPLVNAHTDASYHRHYLYLDSRAWTPTTKYAFVHLPDVIC